MIEFNDIKALRSHRIIKFLVTGGLNTTVSYLGFTIFIWAGINYLLASAIGYCIGIINSYYLSKGWTFQTTKASTVSLFFQFCIINFITLGMNLSIMYILVGIYSTNVYLAQVMAILMTMTINFISYRWLFKS